MYSQNKLLKTIPFYFDKEVITAYCDSLKTKGVDTFYVFLTQIEDNTYSFLIWKEEAKNHIIKIEDTLIFSSTIEDMDFLKANYKNLAVMEKEDKLKFTPPIIIDSECSYFIFITKKINYLISCEDCSNFILDKDKYSQRKNFIDNVQRELKKIINTSSWTFSDKYDRNN